MQIAVFIQTTFWGDLSRRVGPYNLPPWISNRPKQQHSPTSCWSTPSTSLQLQPHRTAWVCESLVLTEGFWVMLRCWDHLKVYPEGLRLYILIYLFGMTEMQFIRTCLYKTMGPPILYSFNQDAFGLWLLFSNVCGKMECNKKGAFAQNYWAPNTGTFTKHKTMIKYMFRNCLVQIWHEKYLVLSHKTPYFHRSKPSVGVTTGHDSAWLAAESVKLNQFPKVSRLKKTSKSLKPQASTYNLHFQPEIA